MNRANRLPFALLSGVALLAVAIWLFQQPLIAPTAVGSPGKAALISVACILLYLVSHLFRAVRVALIGVYVHQTSFRTLVLLNLSVAPWSMVLPFKLDELIRLNELRSINGSLARAVLTIVIDRSMDGPMLILFSSILALNGNDRVALVAGCVGAAMVAVTIGFFTAATALEFIQNYIFIHHYKPRALRALQLVDRLRSLAGVGRATIKSAAPLLLLLTGGIWVFETGAVAIMLSSVAPAATGLPDALAATLVRANSGWRALLLGDELGFPAALITRLFCTGLLVIWPFTVWLYVRRRRLEIGSAEFLGRHWGQT